MSLLFSALCFSFINPGGRELREGEKEKKKQGKKIARLAGAI
jgi:hypothetical protein